MSQVVLLDSGPIGLITNPNRSPASAACTNWIQTISTAGVRVIIPEITDYEVQLVQMLSQAGMDIRILVTPRIDR